LCDDKEKLQDTNKVLVYTDGGSSPNPGLGGWGAVLISPSHGNHVKEISGSEANTTNNRMELTAAIKALETLKKPCSVTIFTDSEYLKKAFTDKWLEKWQGNGWLTSAKKPVLNEDLWRELVELDKIHDIKWEWVKGHAANKYNERCDMLVRLAREKVAKNV
jgi:ribonuclease HI